MRWVCGVLTGLLALLLALLSVGFAVSTLSQGYEAWWVGFPVGLPWVLVFGGWSLACWLGCPARPWVGTMLCLTGLVYAWFMAGLVIVISGGVAQSPSLLAGIAFVGVIPVWVAALIVLLLAWAVARGHTSGWAKVLYFLGLLGWPAAFLGFWVFLGFDPDVLAVFLLPGLVLALLGAFAWPSRKL